MNNSPASPGTDSTVQLKTIYEQSLAILSEPKPPQTNRLRARLASSVPLYIDPVSLQKRAVDDAAKALATLWGIPAPARSGRR